MSVIGHNIYGGKVAVSNPRANHHLFTDSIGVQISSRIGTGIAYLIEAISGQLPTRVIAGSGHSGTNQRLGMGFTPTVASSVNQINAQQGDIDPGLAYVTADGRAPLTADQGFEFPQDGTNDFGTVNSKTGTIGAFFARSTDDSTSFGAIKAIVPQTLGGCRISVRPFVQAGSGGLPDRTYVAHDGNRNGPVVATFNPAVDVRGYRHLGEDPNLPRPGGAIEGMVAALPSWEVTNQVSSGNPSARTMLADLERTNFPSNDAIGDGTNFTCVGWEIAALDLATGIWIPGPSLIYHGGISWNTDSWAFNVAASSGMPKTVLDSQLQHGMDAWEFDTSDPNVHWLVLAVEAGETRAEYRDRALAFMNRLATIDALNGKPAPHFMLVVWHRQGNLTLQNHEDFYGGYEDAAKTPPAGCTATAIDGGSVFDRVVMNGSAEAIAKVAEKGRTTVSLGPLVDIDVSDGDYLDGPELHQKDDAGNAAIVAAVRDAILEATAPIPISSGTRSNFRKRLVDPRLAA